MKILLATNNSHKKEELEIILKPHLVFLPSEIGVDFDAEETGADYLENALIKARTLFQMSEGWPVIADDSGLSVPVLGGAPGIYSARYGSSGSGEELKAEERNALLLQNMRSFRGGERAAFFVCCMALIVDEYRFFSAQETFNGVIAEKPSGAGGFGYDPVFYLPQYGKTVSELNEDEKNRISHRGRAGLRVKALLDSLDAAP